MFHSRTINNRINRLHERALRLPYKEPTASFEGLLGQDKSFNIHHRNLQKLVTEIFKIKNNMALRLYEYYLSRFNNPYNSRNAIDFKTSNVHTVHSGTETIPYRGPKTWSLAQRI